MKLGLLRKFASRPLEALICPMIVSTDPFPPVRESTLIRGVYHVELKARGDLRGAFVETYRKEWIPNAPEMVQLNRADRQRGCLVRFHYHLEHGDYWYVPFGEAFVALHDLRTSSVTCGATETLEMGGTRQVGIYIPPGVAHGFYSRTDMTILYAVDQYYNQGEDEHGVAWNDPTIGLDWPDYSPLLSKRDKCQPMKAQLLPNFIPR